MRILSFFGIQGGKGHEYRAECLESLGWRPVGCRVTRVPVAHSRGRKHPGHSRGADGPSFVFTGTFQVGVHIADVSYFVPQGSQLDKVAAERATSVYLVQKVKASLVF